MKVYAPSRKRPSTFTARKNSKTSKSKKSEEKLEEERKTPNSNHVVKNSHPKKDDTLQGHENIQPEQTQPIPDHLQHNYKFARICSECYVQNKVISRISSITRILRTSRILTIARISGYMNS